MGTVAQVATPETAYRLYRIDVATHGARGAYARVGRSIGRSDETVRRWVHQQETIGDDLAYVGPPGGYPEPEPMPQTRHNCATSAPPSDTERPTDDSETSQTLPHVAAPLVCVAPRRRRVASWPWARVTIEPNVWAAVAFAVWLCWVAFPR